MEDPADDYNSLFYAKYRAVLVIQQVPVLFTRDLTLRNARATQGNEL